jgi:5-methylcytosine-specific restriction endonuclease McrA
VSVLITQQRLQNDNLLEEDFKRIQSELRDCFLKSKNPDRCELCGEKLEQKDLILHHITPVADNYMFEADPDNLIFVCKDCHTKLHQKDGCQIGQLRDYSIENKLCFDTGKKVKSN